MHSNKNKHKRTFSFSFCRCPPPQKKKFFYEKEPTLVFVEGKIARLCIMNPIKISQIKIFNFFLKKTINFTLKIIIYQCGGWGWELGGPQSIFTRSSSFYPFFFLRIQTDARVLKQSKIEGIFGSPLKR